ncbi:Protein-lysine N-methyltransferase [uncultured archaeon]|nr:Protein-lysine N-methyltransferase [uncultured archaeon]
MKIEEYLKTLPQSIMTGEDVELRDETLKEIFKFSGLSKDDVFYHLGCGNGKSIAITLEEFGVRKAIGIDNDNQKVVAAKSMLEKKKLSRWSLRCEDVLLSDISDATVIMFWFSDEQILEKMVSKFSQLKEGCKIITIFGPLPDCLPDKVDFPFILNKVPFKKANNLKDQILSVFGTDCIDFAIAWEFADRYIKAIGSNEAENDRFVTILQSLVIWINAKNLGIACGDDIPLPIRNYMGILKTYFNIELEHLLH